MRCKWVFVFVLGLVLLQSASAGFVVENYSIQSGYEPNQSIAGWFKISFSNQSINGVFEDSLGNSINLSKMLELNSGYQYNLNESNQTINSEPQKLYINVANFSVSTSETQINYSITLDGEFVLSENISIFGKKALVSERIEEKESGLEDLNQMTEQYSLFLRSRLNEAIGTSEIEKDIENIKLAYNNSNSTEEYDSLLDELDLIKIPELITEPESAYSISFVPSKDIIDLDFIEEIGGGNYSLANEDVYKDRIIFWVQENLNPKLTLRKLNAVYDEGEETLLTYIEININQRPSSKVFFIADSNELIFDGSYGEQKKSGYIYIDFSEAGNKISFTTTEELSLDNLPFFISPSLSDIPASDIQDEIIDSDKESKISKGLLFSLLGILLIIIFAVSYLFLKAWYDKKYENYLFKNKNQLYNLVNYITNSKNKGVPNPEIEKSLKKAKWTSEQIRYIMRKYAGKRTGLWIPKFGRQNNKKTI